MPPLPHVTEPSGNRLLDALPAANRSRLLTKLRRTPIHRHQILQEPWEPVEHVYFPLTGVISLVTVLRDGVTVETATIGSEGMAGIQAALAGGPLVNGQAVGQVPGEALVMEADAFRVEVDGDRQLRDLMLVYLQALFAQISQAVACNSVHEIEQRTAKWLLETHDRVHRDTFLLTQELLAQMLGVTRPSVTVAARTLQQAGLIRYRRGEITVLDRDGLEEAACECYQSTREAYERLIARA
jgi:CRP-like cAMP-binding protein